MRACGLVNYRIGMIAQLLVGHGGLDKYRYKTELKIPKPTPGEVLIKVEACGINNTDLWTREGAYAADDDEQGGWQPLNFPKIQGADVVGVIAECGQGVDEKRIGELVLVNPTIYPPSGDECECKFIGSERDGGFASHCVVPARNAIMVPNTCVYTPYELASFACASQTAWHMIKRSRLQKGERVIITGASGGVGTSLVQMSKFVGAYVIAVCSSSKAKAVRDIGADFTIDRRTGESKKLLIEALKKHSAEMNGHKAADEKDPSSYHKADEKNPSPCHVDVVLDNVAGAMVIPLLEVIYT
ncbi:hypothetical protein AAMO2058_000218900 [Amorphochlora amoebiformis]